MLENIKSFFKLKENKTSLRREISGGVVTFFAMSYIVFIQPALLAQAGMDFNSVMAATCISAAFGSILMGLWANYPIGLAPGMGVNFFFVYTVVLMLKVPWQNALGMVFISGVLFLILSVLKVREKFIDSVPQSFKSAITAGIGLLIGFIGLCDSGIIMRNNSPLMPVAFLKDLTAGNVAGSLKKYEYASGALKMGDLTYLPVIIAVFGFIVISVLIVRKVKGAVLWGLLLTTAAGLALGVVEWNGLVASPPSVDPTFLKLSFRNLFTPDLLPVVFVFLLMDFFDTAGTLMGVADRAGLMKNNKLPGSSRAFAADAMGTIAGSLLGTSTVTSYVESAAGVEEGARTGLASVITGVCFILALFFAPFISMVGAGYSVKGAPGVILHPVTAPVLIVVAFLMLQSVVNIEWKDYSEAIPAAMVLIGMPLTMSIGDGLAMGFSSYLIIKLLTGKIKDLNPVITGFGIIFICRFIFIKI